MTYYPRLIDGYLLEWSKKISHKPVLLRGARQVGKSSAVRHLGKQFKYFVEINFEKNPNFITVFDENLDVERIISQLSALTGKPITDGDTLLFFDEIQDAPKALMALRFFKEDRPNLHVIAAGSLLEIALEDLPTFGVGRIHSMFMYPMTFDEFLCANGEKILLEERNKADFSHPLAEPLHIKLSGLFRTYMLVGGMPEVVDKWVRTKDCNECQESQDDLLVSYEADFAKYKKKVDPELLRSTLRSAALQLTSKFVYSRVAGNYKAYQVQKALHLLILAGLLIPVVKTKANGEPLGSEGDPQQMKILTLDSGLTLRLMRLTGANVRELSEHILLSSSADLVNKGSLAELIAGLEILRYQSPNIHHDIFYWAREERNAMAEVDYLTSQSGRILPIEVKAGTQGGMKSLWQFMTDKKLSLGVRSSLENFGKIVRETEGETKEVAICPLYALSQLSRLI